MKPPVQKQNFGEIVMIIAYAISVLKNIIDSSSLISGLHFINRFFLIIFFICVSYKLLVQRYTFLNLAILLIIGMLCAYSNLTLKYYSFFYSFIFICALQDVDINKILKASIVIKISMLSIHVFIYFILFFLKPEVIVSSFRNGVERQAFFFHHANLFTAYLAWTCLEIIYVYHRKLKVRHYLLIELVNMFFYIFTNSNTGTIVVTSVVILSLLSKRNIKGVEKAVEVFSKYGFLLMAVFFYIIARIYPILGSNMKIMWENFNNSLTGRLRYGAYGIDVYGITWFGRTINFPSKSFWRGNWLDSILFDNTFYEYLILMGTIFLIIISISLIMYNHKMSYIEKIFICSMIYYGIMEANILNVFICFPLILIGKYMYETDKIEQENPKEEEAALWMPC